MLIKHNYNYEKSQNVNFLALMYLNVASDDADDLYQKIV